VNPVLGPLAGCEAAKALHITSADHQQMPVRRVGKGLDCETEPLALPLSPDENRHWHLITQPEPASHLLARGAIGAVRGRVNTIWYHLNDSPEFRICIRKFACHSMRNRNQAGDLSLAVAEPLTGAAKQSRNPIIQPIRKPRPTGTAPAIA
jgi:hypothetical protein